MENKDIEQLEKYLLDRMTPEERSELEQRLEREPGLQREKDHLEKTILAIEYNVLQNKLKEYSIPADDHDSGKTTQRRIVEERQTGRRGRIINWRLIGMAASILLIGWVSYLLLNRDSFSKADIDAIFYSDPGLPTVMSKVDRYAFYDAMVDYKVGRYEEAIEKWEHTSGVGQDTLDYYKGMAWLNMGEWKMAGQSLAKLPGSSPLKEKADWYFIRVYIELGEYDKAEQQLLKVSRNREGYQEIEAFLAQKTE